MALDRRGVHVDPQLLLLLLLAAAAAGWFDAVVGGGGLLQLPALMLAFPGLPVAGLIGTDKLASTLGTTSAAMRLARSTPVDLRLVMPMGAMAVIASGVGLVTTTVVPRSSLTPLILIALCLVLGVVLACRDLGLRNRPERSTGWRRICAVLALGAALPFYNGLVGPGTGTMMVVVLTLLLGMDFVAGSAASKVINVGANVGALAVAASTSEVLWLVGAAMALCNIAGAQFGARCVLGRGVRFVRVVLVVIVSALIINLGRRQLFGA